MRGSDRLGLALMAALALSLTALEPVTASDIEEIWHALSPPYGDLFAWLENLECGIDLFDQQAYRLPTAKIDPVSRKVVPALQPVGDGQASGLRVA